MDFEIFLVQNSEIFTTQTIPMFAWRHKKLGWSQSTQYGSSHSQLLSQPITRAQGVDRQVVSLPVPQVLGVIWLTW